MGRAIPKGILHVANVGTATWHDVAERVFEAAGRSELEEKFEHRLAATKAELQVEIHSVQADLIKWTFVFWVPVVLAVIGLYFKT